ncbi:MAG: TlpA disulfide reductase family protein [Balneola sp.]
MIWSKFILKISLLIGILILFFGTLQARQNKDSVTIRFEVHIPSSTPQYATIFMGSSLNIWDPGAQGSGMGQKDYSIPSINLEQPRIIILKKPIGTKIEYKYTRGSIFNVEEEPDYTYKNHRTAIFDKNKTVKDTVAAWRDLPPKEIESNWPLLALTESNIDLRSRNTEINGFGTLVYDFEMGSNFYDLDKIDRTNIGIPKNLDDTVLYSINYSSIDDESILVLAGKKKGNPEWDIYLDLNSDNAFHEKEYVFSTSKNKSTSSFLGQVYYPITKDGITFYDSVQVKLDQAFDLPPGYSSSYDKNAPNLAFQTPFAKRKATINGNTFHIISNSEDDFNDFFWVGIDRNKDDAISIQSGSNEKAQVDISKMYSNNTFYLHPKFKLDDKSWEIVSIDEKGGWIRLKPHKDIPKGEFLTTGSKAPNWSGKLLNGKTIKSESLKGKYVLLDFWGSWCGPCIQEIPQIKEVHERFDSQKFKLLSFAYEKETTLRYTLDKYDIQWSQILDQKGVYADQFQVSGYPTKYLIDPNGIIIETGRSLSRNNIMKTLSKYLED